MYITIEQLVTAIQSATKTIKVHTPSTDYYARRGDHDVDTLEIVDPQRLIEELRDLPQ